MYLTRDDVARMLGVRRQDVDRWIADGSIPTVDANGDERISYENLKPYLQNPVLRSRHLRISRHQRISPGTGIARKPIQPLTDGSRTGVARSGSGLSRRQVLETVGIGLILIVAERIYDSKQEKIRLADEAKDLFYHIFGQFEPNSSYDIDFGRRYPSGHFHPDNVAAGRALRDVLGQPATGTELRAHFPFAIDLTGHKVLIGGPTSTESTARAWEYEGVDNRLLKRRDNPIIPLRWWGHSDAKELEDRPAAGWWLENVGKVCTANWPFIDRDSPEPLYPRLDRNTQVVDNHGRIGYALKSNYLLVTKLPNFMSPDFESQATDELPNWPTLLVFEGNHGLGTRATELLLSPEGRDALKAADEELHGARRFQLLFEVVKDPDEMRFNKVFFKDAKELDSVGEAVWLKAHRKFQEGCQSDEPIEV